MITSTLITIFAITAIVNILLFIPASIFKTDKFTDAAYSSSFLTTILYFFFTKTELTMPNIILTSLVSIWALRLGIFLAYRISIIKEDKRFDDTRNNLKKFALFWFYQCIVASLILSAATFFLQSNQGGQITTLQAIAVGISIFALSIETAADHQKLQHIKAKKKSFISSGLWAKSQHPNYFGEILFWIGIYLFSISNNTITNLIGAVSPLCIYITLRYLSGIPLLQKSAKKKYGSNKSYQKYIKETPLLIPKI